MEWVDAVLLTPHNILPSGYIIFNRRQKRVEEKIRIGAKAKAIIDKYPSSGNSYILPLIKDSTSTSLIYARYSLTRYLKIAGRQAGIVNISYASARST